MAVRSPGNPARPGLQRRRLLALAAGTALPQAHGSNALPPPLSMQALRTLAAEPRSLQRAGDIDGGPGFSAYLVAYPHAGLRLHAMVAVPLNPAPAAGHPVLIANHGFHPDPPRYGFTPEGRDARPGNYYRPVPPAFASAGFMVVMPDYRGHNVSQGLAFSRSAQAQAYYAEDVVALMAGLGQLEAADTGNTFMWGHSMGGPVTLLALLARIGVRGASLWSTSRVDPELELSELQTPLMLQHAIGDASTSHAHSARVHAELRRLGRPCLFHTVAGNQHFFAGADFDAAVARDVEFFRALMLPPTSAPR